MPATEDRLARLPAWARQRIERLERDLAEAHERLAAGPAGSDTFADPYMTRRPLGRGTSIEFVARAPGDRVRSYFTVRLDEDGRLHVMGSDGFAIEPRSSNLVLIRLEDS